MFCKNCGNKIIEGAKFCAGCGGSLDADAVNSAQSFKKITEIKCGNCSYIGPGEKARSVWAQVLAWVAVIFVPIVTIIYFLATFKWRCPKCKSTFLGVKKLDGVYHGQRGGAGRTALVIICVLIGIAIIGIMSSIVLASLNSARAKAQEASAKEALSTIQVDSILYFEENKSYSNFCTSRGITNVLNGNTSIQNLHINCNDNEDEYAITFELSPDKFMCVDNSENGIVEIEKSLFYNTQCN